MHTNPAQAPTCQLIPRCTDQTIRRSATEATASDTAARCPAGRPSPAVLPSGTPGAGDRPRIDYSREAGGPQPVTPPVPKLRDPADLVVVPKPLAALQGGVVPLDLGGHELRVQDVVAGRLPHRPRELGHRAGADEIRAP